MHLQSILLLIIIFTAGASCGSFLAQKQSRSQKVKAWKTPFRSYCDHCKKPLQYWELIPILSYLLQRGKCSSCKSSIPVWYFGYEVCGGMLALIGGWTILFR